jgi:hypothetical protein
MSESVQIVLGLVALAGVFVLTRLGVAWQLKRASGFIIRDLQKQGAVDPVSAVELPYTRQNLLRIGMRNYYAKAIEYLQSEGTVGKTDNGRYYLRTSGSAALPDASGELDSRQ